MMASSCLNKSEAIGVSVSESPDLRAMGMSDRHLRDAMAEIALHVLASGRSLAYGGDLRPYGFTKLLFELLERYRDHPRHSSKIVVTDYLAWPIHIQMTLNDVVAFSSEHDMLDSLVFLARDGTRIAQEQRLKLSTRRPDKDDWVAGLTAMRTVMLNETQARIVLGGRVEDYKGAMPGVAEEAHLSLQARHPVYLIGGFGGCARDIAETIGLADRWAGSRDDWPGRRLFRNYSPDDVNNGLTRDENLDLVRTPHIQKAIGLVLHGLRRIKDKGTKDAQSIH